MNSTIRAFGFSLQVNFLDYMPVTSKDRKVTRLSSTILSQVMLNYKDHCHSQYPWKVLNALF